MVRDEFRLHSTAGGKRRRTRNPAQQPASRLVTVKVHPEVWQTAYGLSGGDTRRIQIISPDEVLVTNHRSTR